MWGGISQGGELGNELVLVGGPIGHDKSTEIVMLGTSQRYLEVYAKVNSERNNNVRLGHDRRLHFG